MLGVSDAEHLGTGQFGIQMHRLANKQLYATSKHLFHVYLCKVMCHSFAFHSKRCSVNFSLEG